MIKKLIRLLLFFASIHGPLHTYGQANSAKITFLARPQVDKVLLRWAVSDPLVWRKANTYGYYLERTLISKDGAPVLPLQKKILNNNQPLLPAPLADWEAPFDTDPNAAIVAQALYGDGFQAGNLDPVASIMAINEELEQRFIFALVAAEQSFEAAKLAGWGYEDENVLPGEKYLYKVWINTPLDQETLAQEATLFTGVDFYEALPEPQKPLVFFKENQVDINWNFSSLQQTYTHYHVERSTDDKAFQRVNSYPIFNAEKVEDNKSISLSYTDSIPNGTTFYYRIVGNTTFGETGPPSQSVSGTAKETLKYVPQITGKQIISDDTVVLEWEFDRDAEVKITGFDILRSNTDQENFKVVVADLPPEKRSYTYRQLKRINYFKVVAKGKNGDARPSFASIVQPVDSIPPKRPKGLRGTIDTTGVVTLQWTANTEPDLKGYRIFRANNKKAEFSEITKSLIKDSKFTDTIPVKNLNKAIYYKLLAQDQRYNPSKFSEILTLDKPDLLPPSPTVMEQYQLDDNSVILNWIPSSSKDVVVQRIYRNLNSNEQWELVKELDITTITYTDINLTSGLYRYVVLAVDKSGLESAPESVLNLEINQNAFQDAIKRFTATPNREIRSIMLSWKLENTDVIEIQLYKTEGEGQLKLFKILDGAYKNYEDKELQINTTYQYGIKVVTSAGIESSLKLIVSNY